jgi:hypothetical protein
MLCDEIASGGMASVHFGLLLGDERFTRTVAIKRLHPSFAKDPEFGAALLDEGRLQARVFHPNVAAVLDVVRAGGELLLVMEYLHGAPLSQLHKAARAGERRPSLGVVRSVMVGALRGLHAAHEARAATGEPLELVHRDVSPQNILVGADGTPRIVDFGIARAAIRSQVTRDGVIKGKPGYMAPEQFMDGPVGRAVDVYAAGVVLWELVTSERLFPGGDIAAVARKVLDGHVDPPSAVVPGLPEALDAIVAKAVAADPSARFATASEMADALEGLGPLASPVEVAAWVREVAGASLAERQAVRERIERDGELEQAQPRASSDPGPSLTTGPAVTASSARDVAGADVLTVLDRTPGRPSGGDAPGTALEVAPARGRRVPYAVLAGVAVLLLAAAGAGLAGGASPAETTTAALPPSAAPAAATAGNTLNTLDPTTAAATSPAPNVAPAGEPGGATRAGDAQATPPAATQAATPKRAAGALAAPRPPTASEPCSTVGKDGIKRWNPKCK